MRIMHMADLHIGKSVNGFSMLDDQRYVLNQISSFLIEERVEVLILAGDIYDRPVPPAEAVALLDTFLTETIRHGIKILMIAGNHDSPERLGFAGDLLKENGLYIGGGYHGEAVKVTLEDEYGPLHFYLLPYVKPAFMKKVSNQDEISWQDSVKEAIKRMKIDSGLRNILVSHLFVGLQDSPPMVSDSEIGSTVGQIDLIDGSLFDDFDYTALGHLHRPHWVGDKIRYAGSPLKYSFSEAYDKKSVTLIELGKKGDLKTWVRELVPYHDMRMIRGELKELMREEIINEADREDYLQVTLTNKEELMEPIVILRSAYPNVMQLILEKNKILEDLSIHVDASKRELSCIDLYKEFYEDVTQREFDEEHKKVLINLLDQIP